jgi:dihydrofolate synthase / folylpolyglutamate synthase
VAEKLRLDLTGAYQLQNIAGVWATRDVLIAKGWKLSDGSTYKALESVVAITGLKGRWQQLRSNPDVFCDTAHNAAGLSETIRQFASVCSGIQRFVIGFVADKDISGMLALFPKDARYYFCAPSNLRALGGEELAAEALKFGLHGKVFENVNEALKEAILDSAPEDGIYVGGSTFVVADLEEL